MIEFAPNEDTTGPKVSSSIAEVITSNVLRPPSCTLGTKAKHIPSAIMRIIKIFNCLAYDWPVEDE
jgi:hypothetical protein